MKHSTTIHAASRLSPPHNVRILLLHKRNVSKHLVRNWVGLGASVIRSISWVRTLSGNLLLIPISHYSEKL